MQVEKSAQSQLLTMQIIAGALAWGVLVFAGVTLFLGNGRMDGEPSMVGFIAVGFGAMSCILAPVMRRATVINTLKMQNVETEDDARDRVLASAYMTGLIVGCAILEGAAFFNLVIYMTEHWIGNFAAAAVLLGGILVQFPTRGKLDSWMDQQQRDLRDREDLEGP